MMKYPQYESYKDSGVNWIGEIPVSWVTKRLKFLTTESLKYGANISAELDDIDLPRYIRITDIDSDGNLKDETFRSLEYHHALSYFLKEGDILFARSGATVGKTFIYKKSWGKCAFAGYLIKASIKENNYKSRYIYYYSKTHGYQKWIESVTIQATIQNVSAEKYASLWLPIPSPKEQQSIANFLDKETTRLDALIAKKQQLIENLKEKRIAIISHTVTKGLNPNVPMKDSGIEWLGAVPEGWGVKRLKYLSVINPVASEIKHLELSDEVSFVPMESISENGGMKTDKTKELEAVRQGYTYFKEEDVVIAKITPCFENGKGSIAQNLVNNIGFGTTELHVVRCNPEHLDFKYFFYITNTHQFLKLGESEMFGAGGQKRVPTEFVKNYPIAYPIDMKEQRRIIQFLDKYVGQILSIIDRTQKTISKLQEYKTALISAAVTGKIKVPEQA